MSSSKKRTSSASREEKMEVRERLDVDERELLKDDEEGDGGGR